MRIKTHPGEILLEEFLKPHNMMAHTLSMAIHVPSSRIGDIVNGKRCVSADTAIRLARFFGTTAQFWLNLQTNYDLSVIEARNNASIASIVPLSAQGTQTSGG